MTSPVKFVSEVRDELSKVVWPTKEEIIRLTAVVLIISLIIGLFLGGLDLFFTALIQKLLTS